MAKKDTATPNASAKRTACPITRQQFNNAAPQALAAKFHDGIGEVSSVVAPRREFSTGSLGYYTSEKIVIMIDGVPCKAQVQVSIQLVGSKDLK